MTKVELQKLSDYFVKRFFGIPKITVGYSDLEEGTIGNFILSENDDFDIKEEDPEYAKLLEEAPEYRDRTFSVEGLTVNGRKKQSFTDPACRPNFSICISNAIKKDELVVVGTLLHELTHYYCWYLGYDYSDGDRQFEKKLKEFGFPSNFDRKFNKETKEWEDDFNYRVLKKYLDDFRKQS